MEGGGEQPPPTRGVGGPAPAFEGQGRVRPVTGDNGETTHVSYLNEYDLPGGALGKMAGTAVRKVTGRELDASLENCGKSSNSSSDVHTPAICQ